jgi:hypothetical protein
MVPKIDWNVASFIPLRPHPLSHEKTEDERHCRRRGPCLTYRDYPNRQATDYPAK